MRTDGQTDRQTDRHDEANRLFSQFLNVPKSVHFNVRDCENEA